MKEGDDDEPSVFGLPLGAGSRAPQLCSISLSPVASGIALPMGQAHGMTQIYDAAWQQDRHIMRRLGHRGQAERLTPGIASVLPSIAASIVRQ
jgi:hypothetical protein